MVRGYWERYHKPQTTDRIPYAGRIYDAEELVNLTDSALEFWLTAGRYTEIFEKKLASFLNVKHSLFVNSGSSANLLAFMALTSPLLGERAIRRGDEVITVACAFPTTVAPLLQFGAVPVFLDVTIPQYNIDAGKLEDAYSPKTKAVILAHTLGNPFDLATVKAFCARHDLWLIEDNCDALGSRYSLEGKERFTGTVGDIGTSSFYPPHHITTGEGGAVYTNNEQLYGILRSLRDWGRDCICPSGMDNCCGHRFDGQFGELPAGYDHKYVYAHLGYNLKATDMQAAIGVAQLEKLPDFIEKRRRNFEILLRGMKDLESFLILPAPAPHSVPSWFGFALTCRRQEDRGCIVRLLEEKGIQTRMLFAGNLLRHPCFDALRASDGGYQVCGTLENTDTVLRQTFWLGVYPGLTSSDLEKMTETLWSAFKK